MTGVASYTTSTLPAAFYFIKAVDSGDANFTASTSLGSFLTINSLRSTSINLQYSPGNPSPNSPVTLTATVNTGNNTPAATGTVTTRRKILL